LKWILDGSLRKCLRTLLEKTGEFSKMLTQERQLRKTLINSCARLLPDQQKSSPTPLLSTAKDLLMSINTLFSIRNMTMFLLLDHAPTFQLLDLTMQQWLNLVLLNITFSNSFMEKI
jgi:hypothetical protein